jgi:hypothetical protein
MAHPAHQNGVVGKVMDQVPWSVLLTNQPKKGDFKSGTFKCRNKTYNQNKFTLFTQ